MSLDGTDFRIYEPTPFDKKWYSHKFHCAGLRYEVGLNIRTGDIVHGNGGFPCGAWPDLKIARFCFIYGLEPNEKALADLGYRDSNYFIIPNENNSRVHKRIMSRHETVNRRLKQFNILSKTYRHNLKKHPMCFFAILNIVQMEIENGAPLFQVSYSQNFENL